jgi:ATP-dependent RNA helicase DeaD
LTPKSSASAAAPSPSITFADLGLRAEVLAAVRAVGYESPSPIQAASIPVMLRGEDLLGQAQTGTGKTAAFALPILSMLTIEQRAPQALVLVPTRELAIQVAEAFQTYAAHLPGFHVLPIYGGQSYTPQLQALKRGAHVIVGTPGRIMDHLERGTLDLSTLRQVVLDEADEMLQMGFVDAIDTILAKVPTERQVVLYSATMAPSIKRIAEAQMRSPVAVTIKASTTTATNIRQRYWVVSGMHKLDALTRLLEVESFDAMLVFARTKQATVELAEKLEARGFSAAPLNGDMAQPERERTIQRLKAGVLDIVVATDVAARGLDVERVSHVLNFDVPYDSESYVHRIGRTGRAGRSGEAILFIAPRERNMLRIIERATRQAIEPMAMPTVHDVNRRRVEKFKAEVVKALGLADLAEYRGVVEEVARESGAELADVAAAIASLVKGDGPLLLARKAPVADEAPVAFPKERPMQTEEAPRKRKKRGFDEPQATYRLEVGRVHGVQPGHIVGAIAHEADLAGTQINGVTIRDDHTLVRLPADLKPAVLNRLRRIKLRGRPLDISRLPPRP